MNSLILSPTVKRLLLPFCLFVCTILLYIPSYAQEHPPKPIEVALTSLTVIKAQDLSFGTFILAANSGTVTVDHTGRREASNNAFLPASMSSAVSPSPALFIVTALPGTLITIQGSNSTISNMGIGKVELTMFDSDPISPFIVPPVKTFGDKYTEVEVRIGGTLTITSATTAGSYGGPFNVTFIQQ